MQSPRPAAIARAYLMSIAFWCGMSLLMGLQYRPLDYHNLWPSLLDLLAQVGERAFALALWTPPIFYLVGKYLPYSKNRVRYVLLWSLGAPVFLLLHTGIFWLLFPPYDDTLHRYTARSLQSWLEMIRTGFADEVFIYLASVVAGHAYWYLKRVRRQEAERYEYQRALAASELQALKMQLHPHFLFNTLHGIATLIDENATTARALIIKLSDLLRTSLDRDSSDLIPLESELKFVRQYLDLEKMRLGNRLNIQWRVAPESSRLLVPQMVLQPLVENAIRHGIAPAREGGWIEVATSVSNGWVNIVVRNSNGATAQTSNGTGLGLHNVEARLKYLFAEEASLSLTFGDDRTVAASVVLPALNSEPANVQSRHVGVPVGR
jgi:hypothetical protein